MDDTSPMLALVCVDRVTAGDTPASSFVCCIKADVPSVGLAYSTAKTLRTCGVVSVITKDCDTGAKPGISAYTLNITGFCGVGFAPLRARGSKPLAALKSIPPELSTTLLASLPLMVT